MNFDSHSLTLKIWDRSTIDHTLDEAIAQISHTANAPRDRIQVTRSGPNLFTVSVAAGAVSEGLS